MLCVCVQIREARHPKDPHLLGCLTFPHSYTQTPPLTSLRGLYYTHCLAHRRSRDTQHALTHFDFLGAAAWRVRRKTGEGGRQIASRTCSEVVVRVDKCTLFHRFFAPMATSDVAVDRTTNNPARSRRHCRVFGSGLAFFRPSFYHMTWLRNS